MSTHQVHEFYVHVDNIPNDKVDQIILLCLEQKYDYDLSYGETEITINGFDMLHEAEQCDYLIDEIINS